MAEVYSDKDQAHPEEQKERRTSDSQGPVRQPDSQPVSSWGFLWGPQDDMSYLHKSGNVEGPASHDHSARLASRNGKHSSGSSSAMHLGTGTDQYMCDAFQDEDLYTAEPGSSIKQNANNDSLAQSPAEAVDAARAVAAGRQPEQEQQQEHGPATGVQMLHIGDLHLEPVLSGVRLGSSSSAQRLPEAAPLRASETLSQRSRHALQLARTSMVTMKEGVKSASHRVASAGERVGKAWNRTLDSAMVLSLFFGVLAVVLLACALPSRKWRQQLIAYEDMNGSNWSRVDLGLTRVQRVQRLNRAEKAGTVWMYDHAITFDELAHSAYCLPDFVEALSARGGASKPYAAAAAEQKTAADAAPAADAAAAAAAKPAAAEEPPVPAAVQEAAAVQPPAEKAGQDFLSRRLQAAPAGAAAATPAAAAAAAEAAASQGEGCAGGSMPYGPLSDPPMFSVTFGRDPAVPGSLGDELHHMRRLLLGPTVFDINCGDLPSFEKAGRTFIEFCVAYFVFAGVGLLAGLLALSGRFAGDSDVASAAAGTPKRMPVNLLGSIAWCTALVLQVAGLALWGVTTDVAACVTAEGGASVCGLGSAAGAAVGSLAMTLLAALCHSVYFTHKYVRHLGTQWETERRLRTEHSVDGAAAAAEDKEGGASTRRSHESPRATPLPPQDRLYRYSSRHSAAAAAAAAEAADDAIAAALQPPAEGSAAAPPAAEAKPRLSRASSKAGSGSEADA